MFYNYLLNDKFLYLLLVIPENDFPNFIYKVVEIKYQI